ncbi:MAG: molybdopterin molybdotransferase MoeA [Oscillospiraceae bacterium]|nr:molybdopterin molybdotransferase MoeA [Oscillospiraceae bacterium]
MKTSISLEEALSLVVEGLTALGVEWVSAAGALGRTLAEDLTAPLHQPPFDRSPLDGYALNSTDTAGANQAHPTLLTVVDTLYAGDVARIPVEPGQAVRIMTGAMIPQGADCVIRQEDVVGDNNQISVFQTLRSFENYCFQGEDFAAGQVLLPAGTRMDAAAVGVLASAGITVVPVHRRPSVCVLCTGDEVVPPETHPLPPGKIYGANGPLLLARLAELGILQTTCALLPDDPEAMAEALRTSTGDLVITTGGVSVGAKDILHEVLPLAGAEQVFWRVKLKPGTPVLFSRMAGKPVLSLSGNPFAAAATFELLARPILAALTGEPGWMPERREAILDTPFEKEGGYRRFLRGRYREGRVALPAGHSAGQLASLVGCNCLVEVPEDSPPLPAGTKVSVLLLHR